MRGSFLDDGAAAEEDDAIGDLIGEAESDASR